MLGKIVYSNSSILHEFNNEEDMIKFGSKSKDVERIVRTIANIEITIYKRPLITLEIGDTQLAIDVLKFIESMPGSFHYSKITFNG